MGYDFYISAIRFIIFENISCVIRQARGIENTILVSVLPLILAFTLHVFIKIKGRRLFIVGAIFGITGSKARSAIRGIELRRLFFTLIVFDFLTIQHLRTNLLISACRTVQSISFSAHIVSLTKIALCGNIFYLYGFKIDKNTLFQGGAVIGYGNFGSRAAQPGMQIHVLAVDHKRIVLRLIGRISGEVSQHLPIVGYFGCIVVPNEPYTLKTVNGLNIILMVAQEIRHVGHDIHAILSIRDIFQAERGLLCLAFCRMPVFCIRIRAFHIFQLIFAGSNLLAAH